MAKNLIGKFEGQEDEPQVVFRQCHFSGEGKCQYHRDQRNRHAKPIGATVRVNNYWICNWHYENGYDRVLRNGETIPIHEQKIQSRLFGSEQDIRKSYQEADAERQAIQEEGA